MPRSVKKGARKNPQSRLNCYSDIKLSDFADSDGKTVGIRRKPLINSFTNEAKNLCTLEMAWLELDDKQKNDVEGSESDRTDTIVFKKKMLKTHEACVTSCEGNDYPIDLWFILSEYIQPEDVKFFAAICKTSYLVSRTYSFWMQMYKRFYKQESNLPVTLRPHCIERPLFLKSSVIRALYHFYPQFQCHISKRLTSSVDLKNLMQLICTSMWRSQSNDKWLFNFKFQSRTYCDRNNKCTSSKGQLSSWLQWDASYYTDPELLLNDVNWNPEEGCKILQVTSSDYVAAPVIMGGHLADAKISLSRDMIKQKLQLTFSFSSYKEKQKNVPLHGSRECGGSCEVVVFDPVENMQLLDWWHPQYPMKNSLGLNCTNYQPVKPQDVF